MIEFQMDGFDELTKNLEDIRSRAEDIDGENNIPLGELFNSKFMSKYTEFNTIDEMVEKSDFEVETEEDFKNIPDDEWDEYVNEKTRFNNWQEMINEAVKIWTVKRLRLE